MAEHIKMTAQEAKQKAEAIRKVILDTYHREVQPSPFFTDLRAGTLSRPRLQGWIKNWYSFALEVNTGMATVYHQFVGFFKSHPELENRIAQKIGEEFTTPAIGGHARMLPILGKALGVYLRRNDRVRADPRSARPGRLLRPLLDRYPARRMFRRAHGRRNLRFHLARLPAKFAEIRRHAKKT